MCLRIFVPTYRRLILFLFFALLPLSGILNPVPPLQVFYSLPYVLIASYSLAVVAQIIYSYILACVYAAAYVSIERSLRKSYPQLNRAAWKRKKAEPAKKRKR